MKAKATKQGYDFAAVLKSILVEKGMMQTELALKTKMQRSEISEILTGKRLPEMKVLDRICSALETSLNFVILRAYKVPQEHLGEKMRLLALVEPLIYEVEALAGKTGEDELIVARKLLSAIIMNKATYASWCAKFGKRKYRDIVLGDKVKTLRVSYNVGFPSDRSRNEFWDAHRALADYLKV